MTIKTFLLPFLLFPVFVSGQILPDSITVVSITYVNNFNGGDSIYRLNKKLIIRHGQNYKLNDKLIPKGKINDLIKEISKSSNKDNSLAKYDLDTVWIKNNPDKLLKLYPDKRRVEWNEKQKEFINKKLTSIQDYQRTLNYNLSSGCCYTMHNSYRYEYQINIFSNGGLLDQVTSRKRVWGYLFPWTNSNNDTLYNYQIESKLNDLVTLDRKTKAPMSGNRLLKTLVENIIDNNMQFLYKLSPYSYMSEIDELKSDFEIISFEEVYARGRYIWNEPKTMKIQLKSEQMMNNVSLYFLASKQGKSIYSRDSIKRDYKTIIERIQGIEFISKFLKDGLINNLDIYYFNNRGINDYNIESVNQNPENWSKHDKYVESLKWYEKSNVTPSFDLNEAIKTSERLKCGCNFRLDKSYIEKAIFFEIIDREKNSSIWFLLPDNKVLLYLMQGTKVLNYDYREFGKAAGLQYPCVLFDTDGQIIKK